MIEECGRLTFYQWHYLIAEALGVGLVFFGLWYFKQLILNPLLALWAKNGLLYVITGNPKYVKA